MATNRDLLKEAIADAKAVKETAIANAKAALEEAFTPYLKEKLSAKLQEMEMEEEADEMEEMMYDKAEEMSEMKEKEDEGMYEEISLDELLAELDEYAEEQPNRDMDGDGDVDADDVKMMKEAEEEEMSIEDMSEDDLKHFIEDVIKDMVSAGELEAGDEGEEEEMEAGEEEMEAGEEEELDEEFDINELLAELEETSYSKKADSKGSLASTKGKDEYKTSGSQEKKSPYSKGEATKQSFYEDNLDEVAELSNPEFFAGVVGALVAAAGAAGLAIGKEDIAAAVKKGKDAVANLFKSKKSGAASDVKEIEELKSELNEINLLNAKLLYTNKIFRNKSLTETQKVKVLTAFDKATTKQEAQLVYETLLESLKVSNTKAPIKESLGSASKVLGGNTSKPIIENDAFSRMRELAFGGKK